MAPAEHEVKDLAGSAEETPVVRTRVIVEVLVKAVPAVRENELGCPSLIAVDFKVDGATSETTSTLTIPSVT